jgi:hypothetical protein
VPKCGGISAREALRAAALASGVTADEIAAEGDMNSKPHPDQIRGKKLVAGHLTWDAHIEAGLEGAITFTILRDPLRRAISHYYYFFSRVVQGKTTLWDGLEFTAEQVAKINEWQHVPTINECPLDILEVFLKYERNAFVYFFSVPWCTPRDQMLKGAYERLNEFTAFGLMERMSDTVRVLNSISPYSVPIEMPFLNKGPNYEMPSSERLSVVEYWADRED